MKKIIFIIFLLTINSNLLAKDKLNIFVSILPQKYFVEQIAGDFVNVSVLVGPGQSPHSYEPLPKQMADISRADLFFTIGVPFEKQFINRLVAVCPDLKIIAMDDGIEKRSMNENEIHSHDHEHENHKEYKDPHIWLDPILAIKQSKIVADSIIKEIPAKSEQIMNNFISFKKRCEELTQKLQNDLLNLKGEIMLVFHPSFGYIADRFGLIQRSVETEGKEPGPKQLASLIKVCKKDKIRVIFVQKQFPVAAAKTVASSINGIVIAIDPLAENIFENLQSIANSIKYLNKK